jgi:two-component system CheB/CheR fusion protein
MGETDELNAAEGPDSAGSALPEIAAPTKNDRAPLSEGELFCAVHAPCFVVGIGASAGGHEPLEHIFTAVPADCDLSFVVVMHIPAEGPSLLADLIRRYTSMEVLTVEEGMPLRPNTVHVIPPGVMLTVKEGMLRLDPSEVQGRPHHPIDRFFTSFAADCGARAIAVVLSGFGLDGGEGVKRIKEGGGIVLVQEPATAINSSMPRNAIATGAADMVLPMEDIPAKIAEIARGECHLPQRACLTSTLDEELQTIFALVRAKTGHDFSSYKRNTVLRRIERRMTVNEAGGIRKYLAILEENPQEAQALCQEILIGVTGFFRDPEAFELLRSEIIPRLFADRDPEDPVRIWHACCATGEEAYSVAMLIQEHLEKEGRQARVQIFATDIDEGAVAQARAGLYPDDIGAEVGEERLKTFFTRYDRRWQVAKRLREMIVFAHHSIIKDPPFSRLDLLVCRNFLIYLDPEMQKRLISLFHMVLKPGGFLFLGGSESVGRNSELFTTVDKKWKIFQRLESGRREETFFPFTSPTQKLIRNTPPKRPAEAGEPTPGAVAEKLLLERYSPPCVIVNEKYEVLHISTRTQRYMEVPVGEPTLDILRMAREELRPALRAAIYKAFTEQKQVTFRGVKMAVETDDAAVNVLVEPLAADPAYGKLAMVILEPAPSPAAPPASPGGESLPGDESSKEMLIRQLEEQLRITHEQLQATSEQLETSNDSFLSANEELMSINEEFQSTNEELQSTNEELETSKEELQALNEELVTVNSELQGKVEELNQSNSDMENLFASSEIATIFLDRGLIIKRFSPAMASIFNLIPADIGRPFRHLAGTIDWPDLPRDAQTVLEKLVPVEREVTALEDGRSFIMRVLPYQTTDGRIDGIVVTLIDITERKRMEEAHAQLAAIVESSDDAIIAKNMNGIILSWNAGAERLFGYRADEIIGKPINLLVPPELQEEEEQILRRLSSGERIEHFETVRLARDGRRVAVSVTASPIMDSQGRIIGASKIARDITLRKLAEEALRRAKEEWERTFASVPDLITILDNEHRVLRVNEAMARRLGVKPEQCVGLHCFEAVHGTSVPPDFCPHSKTIDDGCEHSAELHVARLGGDFVVTTTPLLDEKGERIGSVHIAHDITERKRSENLLSARLRLMEFAVTHSLEEILRETLDEVGELTGSPIGFYHSVEADQQTLSLQAWSSRTVSEFCTAPGQGSHYSIDDAGVWVDCVHQRRPVIHNDYESLPNRKGMPEGHARVIRELVVPISRGELIVAILGVGNKSSDYTEKDVEVVSYLADIACEIFERKRAEEALKESELRLAEIVRKSPSFMSILRGPDHVFEMANEKYFQVIGQRDILGKKLTEALPEIADSSYPQILDGVYKTGEPFTANDVSIMLARGANGKLEEVWLDFIYLPLREPDGTISGIFVHGVDITERKQAEEALRTSYLRSNLLAETTAQLLASDSPQRVVDNLCRRVMEVLDCQAFFNFLVDGKAGRLRLNACAGIPEEEVKKLEWLDYGVAVCGCAARDATRIVAEDIPNTPDPRTELVKSYGIRAYACHPLMAHGNVLGTLSFGTRNRPGFTKDELALMKTVADHVAIAMERKQAEDDLKIAREAAEAASRAKSQFLANMSHELRTPMTGVLGMLQFTLKTPLDAQQQDFVETAHKSARTLLRILNDILDLSKVEAGKLSIEAKPFTLHDGVTGAIDILIPEARRKGLELNYTMADDLPKTVVGDQVRLLQVLTNLCGNAVKFTEQGKVEVRVTAGGETAEGKREITFTVRDTGIGIPDDKKELIFDSFNQADISHARRFGGTGLGLAISRELVERMGGTITCASEEGKGSTFSFTIPLGVALTESETVSMPVAPPPAACAPVSSSEKSKARLLLAEDDPITRQVIGLMLKHSNFDHDIAENGLRAVEMWEKGNYDLVLMDVQMPGQDGFAATGDIREKELERGGHTLILAMTAHAFPEDEKRCLAAGMDAYIPKPIDLQKCIAMIEELIAKRQLEA